MYCSEDISFDVRLVCPKDYGLSDEELVFFVNILNYEDINKYNYCFYIKGKDDYIFDTNKIIDVVQENKCEDSKIIKSLLIVFDFKPEFLYKTLELGFAPKERCMGFENIEFIAVTH